MEHPAGRRGVVVQKCTNSESFWLELGSISRMDFVYALTMEVIKLYVGQDERLCAAQCHYLCIYVVVESKEKM